MFNFLKSLFSRKPKIREDLVACPFCKSQELSIRRFHTSWRETIFVHCNECGGEGPSFFNENSTDAEQDWCERHVRRLIPIYRRLSQIASCPFCDADNISLEDGNVGFHIECHECHALSPEKRTREETIKIWNL